MKICQVVGGGGRGGLEKHFAELCNHLAKQHQVIAVCAPEFQPFLNQEVHVEPIYLERWRYNPVLLFDLFRILKRHRPDIIHAHANKAAAVVGLVGKFLPARYIATVHNLKKNTRMFRNFDKIIAVSKSAAGLIDNPAVEIIYNGIDPPRLPEELGESYLRKAIGLNTSRPVVASVGRLVPAKGFDVLLRAWIDIDADLLIIGDGPERLHLEGLLQELGLGDKVRMLGFRDDVSALLASVSLTVIASRREGFSYVFAESLHARTAVISTSVPICNEVLPAEFLVPVEDPMALRQKIIDVLAQIDEIRHEFAPLFEFAACELTLERMVEKTEDLYSRLLANA